MERRLPSHPLGERMDAPPSSFLIPSVRVSIPKILRYYANTNHSKKSACLISMFYRIPKILRYSLKINQQILKVLSPVGWALAHAVFGF